VGVKYAGNKLTKDDIYELQNHFEASVGYLRFEYCKND